MLTPEANVLGIKIILTELKKDVNVAIDKLRTQ